MNIDTETVASQILKSEDKEYSEKKIWLVDEAGLLSANQAHKLILKAKQEKARIVFIGDTKQLSSVEAGNPFRSLQRFGIETAYLNESLRQKKKDLKAAIDLIANGSLQQGLSILQDNNRIDRAKNKQKKIDSIVADYLALSDRDKQKTLLIAGTNEERELITKKVRDRLKRSNDLTNVTNIATLKAKNLTSIEQKYYRSYQVGDLILPLGNYKKQNLFKDKMYRVIEVDENFMKLKDGNGTIIVNPIKFKKIVYQEKTIDIAVGDRLKWNKNDKNFNRRNGQEFTVLSIDGNLALIEYQSGKQETINLNKTHHLEHALVTTTYSSQGKTAERVLISASSNKALSKESFYVAVSRAKHDLKLYTEPGIKLVEKIQESKTKLNPSDILDFDLDNSSKSQNLIIQTKQIIKK